MNAEESIISVSDMAKRVYLSRSRFHKLIQDGVFPPPSRWEKTSRPYYDQAGQMLCLNVRRRRIGINGEPIFFHKKEKEEQETTPPKKTITYHSQLKTIMKYLQGFGFKSLDKNKLNEMINSHSTSEMTEAHMQDVVKSLMLELGESIELTVQ